MKLLRHGAPGAEKPGLLDADGRIRDLSAHVADIAGDTLAPADLARLAALDPTTLPLVAEGTRLGACVGAVGSFVAIGLNYRDHAAESGMAIPAEPVVFLKATSCISGPNDDIVTPVGSTKLDWEIELGVVIGTTARNVAVENALDHVAGWCIVDDVSERAFQLEHGGSWDKGKGCDTFGPIGPWLVTRDEIPDPSDLALHLAVDGVTRQNGSTRDMIFSVAEIVAYVSRFITLRPGDVVTTGTPAGVGMGQKPAPIWLLPGNVVSLSITGLGTQTQTVVAPR